MRQPGYGSRWLSTAEDGELQKEDLILYGRYLEISYELPGGTNTYIYDGCKTEFNRLWRRRGELLAEFNKRGLPLQLREYESMRRGERKAAVRESADGPKPIVWLGYARDFADTAYKLYERHLIQGKDWKDALRILCAHFVDKNGKEFVPESIIENIRGRERKEGKGGPGQKLILD
jgi:hypothetical protein